MHAYASHTQDSKPTQDVSKSDSIDKDSNLIAPNSSSDHIERDRGGTADKTPYPIRLRKIPNYLYYPIHTSNFGCRTLSVSTYHYIKAQNDYNLTSSLSMAQLSYVTNIAFCNRIVQTALHYGYANPSDADSLTQATSTIQLPSNLADYIETIGLVEMTNGMHVVPHCDEYSALFMDSSRMTDPAYILWEEGRTVPSGLWALDYEWINKYNAAITRAKRNRLKFRSVDNTNFIGSPEMLVSYSELAKGLLVPRAPSRLTLPRAQLGAAYRFRNNNRRDDVSKVSIELFENMQNFHSVDPRLLISRICEAAFIH